MFKDILSSFIDPIVVINKEKKIKYVNPSFEEMISSSINILINNNLNTIVDKDSALILLVNKVLHNERNLKEEEIVLTFKNKIKKKLKVNVLKTYSRPFFIVIQFQQNLTNQKFINHKINSKISKSFSALVEMLMHELKNPLSGIVGAAQLIQKDIEDSNCQDMLNLIKLEAKRINNLLINMEKVSTGEGNISCEFINIHKILGYCKNSAKNSYGSHIIFHEDYDPSLPDVYGNEELLIQIFSNLIKNACEAQPNVGQIIIKTSFERNKSFLFNENDIPESKPLQIEIIDKGIGIAQDDILNIFDPFISRKNGGKGLGLSIVSNSVRTLDASIDVSSEKGLTNFCVNFPLKYNQQVNT